MSDDITQIVVGDQRIGMIGLTGILKAVKNMQLAGEEKLSDALIEQARKANYIASEAEAMFRDALYREYRRYMGEEVSDMRSSLEVRVFGPGCMRCEELMRRIRAIVAELNRPADLVHVRDLRQIAELGPVATPVLMINGKIVTSGKVPSEADLKALLSR